MRFRVLGSNGTYPTPGRPASGYLVTAGDTVVLLDCGPGVFPALLAGGVLPDAIVISHRHADHCLDVLTLFNHLRFDREDVRGVPLIAPPGVYGRLAEFVGAGPGHAFHEVFHRRWVEAGDEMTLGGMKLRFGAAVHPVPAVCVAVEAPNATLAYSGDTGPGSDLSVVANRADLMVCEATHQGDVPHDRYPYHLYAVEAGAEAARAEVGRLLVTHVAPTLDPARSVVEASSVFDGPVDHASPGMEIEL